MRRKSQHYSSWNGSAGNLYRMTDEDVSKMHEVLLDMYKEIKKVCDKYNVDLIAAGGTALGAIRHKGFIPWDDDMDIFMFREDFEQFSSIFDTELKDGYYLLYPGSRNGANCFLPRIVKKGTTFLGMIDETAPYPHGIYIDINILEYAPENKIAFLSKSVGADLRRFISYSVYWNQYKSQSLKEYMLGSEGAKYYKLRMTLGKMFSFRRAEAWFASFDKHVQGKESAVVTVPSGTKKYRGEKLGADIIYPLKTVPFEDTDIKVFNNYDWYLSNLYGDYKTIPDVTNREHHLCLALNFENEL